MNVEKLYYIENFLIFLILVFGILNIFKFKNNYLISYYSNTKSFLIILVSYYVICRLPTIFGYDFLIGNPDETHYITNANKVKFFEFNFDNIDHGTSGIINSIILGWPILFFQDATLFTTRFTNSIIIFLSLFICYKIFLHHNINKKYSLIFISPIVLYFTGREYHVGYTAGIVPIFFCIFAYLTFTKLYFRKHISNLRLFLTGFFLGLIPFTKLQGIPLGFLIGLFILIEIIKQKKIKSLFLLILSTIIPGLLILIPLIYKYNFNSFYITYILNNLARADIFFKPTIENILLYFYSSYLNQFSLIIFIISILGIFLNKKIPHKITIYHALMVITAIYTVITPRYMPDHHMHFVSFFTYIFAIVVFSEILNIKKLENLFKFCFVLLLLAISLKVERWSNYPLIKNEKVYNFRYIDMLKNGDLFDFDNSQKKGDTIFVWGWDSINYLNSGLKAATKRPWFEHEILNQFLKIITSVKGNYKPDRTNYFVNDTLEDLNQQKPKIFINANVKGRIGYDTLGFKEIYIPRKIQSFFQNYKLLNKNGICPKIFMEKKYYEKFIKKYIPPTAIFVSSFEKKYDSSKLDDFEVDRKCNSFWMGLHGQEKTAEFYFQEAEVNKINILSNFYDKGTNKNIIIKLFYKNNLIATKKIKLENYPKWTPVDLNGIKISKVIIKLPKNITGLAEVKLLR